MDGQEAKENLQNKVDQQTMVVCSTNNKVIEKINDKNSSNDFNKSEEDKPTNDESSAQKRPKFSPTKDRQITRGRLAESESDRCAYFVQRKKRTCRMMVKPGKRFCGEHATEEEGADLHREDATAPEGRINCPYDPKHTCDAKKLSKHLNKCPSKPEPLPEFVRLGANAPAETGEPTSNSTIRETSDEKLIEIITRVNSIYENEIQIETEILKHTIVEEEMTKNASFFGPEVLKHLVQNSSLLGNLQSKEILKGGLTFVEFGSGRGQLTYWIVKATNSTKSCRYFLIDRESHRHKFDNKLRDEVPEAEVQRIRADILNLVLEKVPGIKDEAKKVVAVSKHLCGVATDFALQCIHNFVVDVKDPAKVEGILIALCCHHRCLWSSYVGKDYLLRHDFTAEEFSLLLGLTSWAVCGTGKPRNAKSQEEVADHEDGDSSAQDQPKVLARYDRLNLDRPKREEIGRRCKRLIDMGRCDFVAKKIGLKNARLVYYVDPNISLENVAIFATH